MQTFVTADTHFGHLNICRYCNRFLQPGDLSVDNTWKSRDIAIERTKEMDSVLIANWNNKVKPGDFVYHLGDFSFGGIDRLAGYLRRLNGAIVFVFGNHDKDLRTFSQLISHAKFSDLQDRIFFNGEMAEVLIEGQCVVLNHYAMRVWNKSHRGNWHLYGHSHGTLPDDPNSMSFDVGVDCHNYTPLSFTEVRQIMSKKTFKPKDHHERKT